MMDTMRQSSPLQRQGSGGALDTSSPIRLFNRKLSSVELKDMFDAGVHTEQEEFSDDPFNDVKTKFEESFSQKIKNRITVLEDDLKAMGLLDTDVNSNKDSDALGSEQSQVASHEEELETVTTSDMYPRTVPGYAHDGLSAEDIDGIIDGQMTEEGTFIVYRRRDKPEGYRLSYRETGSGAVVHVNIDEEGYAAAARTFAVRGDTYHSLEDAVHGCMEGRHGFTVDDPVDGLPVPDVPTVDADEDEKDVKRDDGSVIARVPKSFRKLKPISDAELSKKFRVLTGVKYCGTLPLKKSLRQLSSEAKSGLCRLAIRTVRYLDAQMEEQPHVPTGNPNTINNMLQEAMGSDEWMVPGFTTGIAVPAATLESKHAGASKAQGRRSLGQIKSQVLPDYATWQTFFMGKDARIVGKAVGLVVSADTGIKIIDEHGFAVEQDTLDTLSFVTGGLDQDYAYFCYVTRSKDTGRRCCRVFRSADMSDYALEVIGDFAQDRYLVLKSLDQAKQRSSSLLSNVVVERRRKYQQQMLRVEQDIIRRVVAIDPWAEPETGDAHIVQNALDGVRQHEETAYTNDGTPWRAIVQVPTSRDYRAPPSFEADSDDDATRPKHPFEVWLYVGLDIPPSVTYLHPPGGKRTFEQTSKPLEDRLETIKFNTIQAWYRDNPNASQAALDEITAFADEQMENELQAWEEQLASQHNNDTGAANTTQSPFRQVEITEEDMWKYGTGSPRTQRRRFAAQQQNSESAFASTVKNHADTIGIDTDGSEFGFSYRRVSRPGCVVSRMEELTDEFEGFAENEIAGGRLDDEDLGAEAWGFDARPVSPPAAKPTTRYGYSFIFVARGPTGFGVKLIDLPEGVFVTGTKAGSTSEEALGNTESLDRTMVIKLNGKAIKDRAECMRILKSDEASNGVHMQISKSPGVNPAKYKRFKVKMENGPKGFGISMADTAEGVVVTKTRVGSPSEKALGGTAMLQYTLITKLNGKVVKTKAECVHIFKSDAAKTNVELEIAKMNQADMKNSSGTSTAIAAPGGATAGRLPPKPQPQSAPAMIEPPVARRVFMEGGPNGFGIKITETPHGIFVTKTIPGTPAERALGPTLALQRMQLIAVNDTPVSTRNQCLGILRSNNTVGVTLDTLQSRALPLNMHAHNVQSAVTPPTPAAVRYDLERADPTTSYGMRVRNVALHDGSVVMQVVETLPDSPADDCGIPVNAYIIEVNGQNLRALGPETWLREVKAPHTTLTVAVVMSLPSTNPASNTDTLPRPPPRRPADMPHESLSGFSSASSVGSTVGSGNAAVGTEQATVGAGYATVHPSNDDESLPLPPPPPRPSRNQESTNYMTSLSRAEMEAALFRGSNTTGAFGVRASPRATSGQVLSVVISPGRAAHFPIFAINDTSPASFSLSATNTEPEARAFATIPELIEYYKGVGVGSYRVCLTHPPVGVW
eukprot:m.1093130 g.1093130  ORF g.1093130 m.1093130 type:complete len:1437 (-) comp24294_c0_seq1:50-4360(-)